MDKSTITWHIAQFWLGAMKTLAATRHSLRADNAVFPPEMDRLKKKAELNYTNAALGLAYDNFEEACDDLVTMAIRSKRNMVVVNVLMHSWKSKQYQEFVIYPADRIPVPPPYIKLETLTTYNGTINGNG